MHILYIIAATEQHACSKCAYYDTQHISYILHVLKMQLRET